MLVSGFRVCRFVIGVIALAMLLLHGLPGRAGAVAVAAERDLAFSSVAAPASDDPLAPCQDHQRTPAACCFGSGCTVSGVALPSAFLTPMSACSAPGYARPASEHRGGIARLPGLHPPRPAA